MYNVVLVDDEEIVLTGIQKVYKLEEYGFCVVGAFTDAREALEKLEGLSPELIITDMKMPNMSGLEFIDRAKRIVPEAEYVVLSGHDDFVYAQESIKLGVSDYLLKPVKKDAFSQMLINMKKRIDERMADQDYFGQVKNWLDQNTGNLTTRFFVELSENDRFDENLYQILERQHGYSVFDARFLLIRIDLRRLSVTDDYLSGVEMLEKEVYELLTPFGRVFPFQMDDVLSFVLTAVGKPSGEWEPSEIQEKDWLDEVPEVRDRGKKKIEEAVESFIRKKNAAGDVLHFGISRIHDGIKQLFKARNECVRIIFMTTADLDIGMEEGTLDREEIDVKMPYLEIEHLFQEILTGNTGGVRDAVKKAYEPARAYQKAEVLDYAGLTTFLILLRIYQTQERVDPSLHLLERSMLKLQRIQHDYPTLESQIRLSEQASIALAEAAMKQGGGSGKKIIQEALDYIEKHYCDNISLTDVADAIGISKNYLANLFKKELDITLINYVTNLRIEEAKRLLGQGKLKMYEIADAVGYKDYAYFSQLFKRHTGMTLSEFRRRT